MAMRQVHFRGALLCFTALAVAAVTAPAHAALVLFTGADDGAGSLASAPNSVAAAANFDTALAALGIEQSITFENSPLGAFSSLTLASGTTLSGANVNNNPQSIVNTTSNIVITPPCTNATCGYNTTQGGANFLLLFGGTATFSFNGDTEAFGAYLTGVQNLNETITFTDGTSQVVNVPNPGFDGGTAFVGFTDADKAITSITINVSNDIVGVDDVRYGTTLVPEPASLALVGVGLIGMGMIRRRSWGLIPS